MKDRLLQSNPVLEVCSPEALVINSLEILITMQSALFVASDTHYSLSNKDITQGV